MRRALLLLPLLLLLPGPRYLLQQGWGQLALLADRTPIDEALRDPDLSDRERRMLAWVPRIKDFGERQVGLSPSRNYSRISLGFDRVVWNVSGCASDRFVSHVYRYPIVGRLPYIGFFDRDDALDEARRLEALGWDSYVRPAGAYSTLGWFEDPLWRSMLAWDLPQLANTVLHELAHATVWVEGQGAFNESFAAFVGDEASHRFLESVRDEEPEAWQSHVGREADSDAYRARMYDLYQRLDGLYATGLDPAERDRLRAAILDEARADWRAADWTLPAYRQALDRGELSNPRLVQFRVYNTGSDDFDDALGRFGGSLPDFVAAAKDRYEGGHKSDRSSDPYAVLRNLGPVPALD